MKVIAIRDSFFNDGTKPTDKAIHKGSIYHVVNKIFDPNPYHFIDTDERYPNGVQFYVLLEQRGKHVGDLFLELPEELFENVETKQETEAI
jgi:hypothetical protein